MIPSPSQFQDPTAPSTLPKGATVNWSEMPTDACDLEFRPDDSVTWNHHLRTIGWILLVAFMALPASFIMQWVIGQSLLNTEWFMLALTVGCGLGLFRVYQRPGEKDHGFVLWFVAPLWAWAVLALGAGHRSFLSACGFLVIGAFPVLILVSDQIAEHALFWMSANPINEFDLRQAIRSSWARRWSLTACEPELKRMYQQGPLLLGVSFLMALGITLVFFSGRAQGLMCLLVFGVILLVITAGRVRHFGQGCLQTWRFAVHWLNYGAEIPYPPYVFQSPSGSPLNRQLLLMLSVFVSACAGAYLTNCFVWALDWHHSESLDTFVASPLSAIGNAAFLIACNILAGAFLWTIAVLFLIAPIVSFHFNLLEKNDASPT